MPISSQANNVALEDTVRAVEHQFSSFVHPSNVTAVIIEPVQGGGMSKLLRSEA